tara:strand:- start:1082 stop:1681 length:600 start_codon:yes stop_codon:yes gene_type:complete
MNEPTPIRIRPKLYQEIKDEMPEIFADTTTWVNYLIRVGYNYHMGLDPCGRLGKPTDRENKNERREVLPSTNNISNISNIINKEKTKNLSYKDFDKEKVIDEKLKPCEHLIIEFWKNKKGYRSEKAFNLLIGDYGLLGIQKKYGLQVVREQLEEGIACKWASITLKKYEMYGRPKNADKEPVTNHPAGRLFKNGRFVDE